MLGRPSSMTKLGELRKKQVSVKGGNTKVRLLAATTANLFDPKTKQCKQVALKVVAENPANRNFVRRNILTKGTIVETAQGKARITSRPGQDGVVNAVLLS